MVARRVRLRRTEAFGETHEHDADRRCGRREVVVDADRVGRSEARQAAVDVTDDRDALAVEIEQLHENHAEQHRDERRGDHGREPLQQEHEGERPEPDQRRAPLRIADVAEEVPQLAEEVAVAAFDAEELRHLADHDREREPDDEALEHRFRDEVREEPEPQQPRGERASTPVMSATTAVNAATSLGSLTRSATAAADRAAGRGHRSDDEVPGASERGVEDERRRRRVQADDRRHAGNRRVGQCFGYEHRPDREARDQVAAQPRLVVAAQRREERNAHNDEANTRGHAARARRS